MESLLDKAQNIFTDMTVWRRYLHQNAEIGFELEKTTAYVRNRLEGMGYQVKTIPPNGLTAMVGDPKKGPVLLLRADMDALPMREQSGLPFSASGFAAHCCGHDLHTTMLLGVASILKEEEGNLQGAVKFMFQPSEEDGKGARSMVEGEILNDPHVDIALAMHVDAGMPLAQLGYGMGCSFASNDNMKITFWGKSGHGARPQDAIDPINALIHVYTALQAMMTREVDPKQMTVLSITSVTAGDTYNVIPESAVMKASLRTMEEVVRAKLLSRINTIVTSVSAAFGTTVTIENIVSVPPLFCNESLMKRVLPFAEKAIAGVCHADTVQVQKMGSEDFSYVTNQIMESGYLFIGAGTDINTPGPYGQHNDHVVFNESVMPYGTAVMCACALGLLSAGDIVKRDLSVQ